MHECIRRGRGGVPRHTTHLRPRGHPPRAAAFCPPADDARARHDLLRCTLELRYPRSPVPDGWRLLGDPLVACSGEIRTASFPSAFGSRKRAAIDALNLRLSSPTARRRGSGGRRCEPRRAAKDRAAALAAVIRSYGGDASGTTGSVA